MDYRFPALTIGVLLAALAGSRVGVERTSSADSARNAQSAVPAAAAADRPVGGITLIRQAIRRLNEQDTVSANVRHRTDLFGQKLVGSGRYYQMKSPKGLKVRFSLAVRSDDRTVSLLHICNGRTVWVRDTINSTVQLSRIDLDRLQKPADALDTDKPTSRTALPGGGLPQLLMALQMDFELGSPQDTEFQQVPVWALSGRWKPAKLAARLPEVQDLYDDQGQLQMKQLPQQLPDRVLLLLGQDDLFPYHIDFRRTLSEEAPAEDTDDWYENSRSMVTMELFEVQFGAALDPLLFVCRLADTDVADETDRYLSESRAAQRKAARGK
jgi:hypothetical protein